MKTFEKWKSIKNYQSHYQVSDFGNVRRLYKNGKTKILKPMRNKGGYLQVVLCNNGTKTFYIHRLVFETFYRRLLPNEQVHHINQVRDDNRALNIVARDAFIHESEHHKGQKLTDYQKSKLKPFEKGYTPWNKGIKLSSQSIAKRTETRRLKRLNNPNYGKHK